MQTQRAVKSPVLWSLALWFLVLTPMGVAGQMGVTESPTPAAEELAAGHGAKADLPLLYDDLDPARIKWLHMHVMCACPKENWSRTLGNCPDNCAIPQKTEIAGMVESGRTNEQIIDFMVKKYGTRARATPGFDGIGGLAYFLPVFALLVMAWFAGGVVRKWKSEGDVARELRRAQHKDIAPEEIARIERDLESLE